MNPFILIWDLIFLFFFPFMILSHSTSYTSKYIPVLINSQLQSLAHLLIPKLKPQIIKSPREESNKRPVKYHINWSLIISPAIWFIAKEIFIICIKIVDNICLTTSRLNILIGRVSSKHLLTNRVKNCYSNKFT